MRDFYLFFYAVRKLAIKSLLVIFCSAFSLNTFAGCAFSGFGGSAGANAPLLLQSAADAFLGNRFWFDKPDTIIPNDSLMGVSTVARASIGVCNSLTDLAGHLVAAVYEPPANAEIRSSGSNGVNIYRIPSDAPGVALDLEFSGISHQGGGTQVAVSTRTALSGGGGTLTNNSFPTFSVRVSLVKTGRFADESRSVITFSGGLGSMRYYSGTNPDLRSPELNVVQIPVVVVGSGAQAHARAPSCSLSQVGAGGSGYITLASVNTSDFSNQAGVIEKGANSENLVFECNATDETDVMVYFETNRPFDGADGVGMSVEMENGKFKSSDVGVQLLIDGKTVRFGQNSAPLIWDKTPDNGISRGRGFYCKNETGKDIKDICGSDMSNSNWLDGGGVYGGDNRKTPASITAKYYQTTNSRPVPQSLTVVFTVNIVVH